MSPQQLPMRHTVGVVVNMLLVVLLSLWYLSPTDATPLQTDRDEDGFVGPVRSVVVETAKLTPARVRWQQSFRQQAHVAQWLGTPDLVAQFTTAPRRWHGQVVGFVGEIYQLLPEQTSVFTLAPFQFIVVRSQTGQTLPKFGEQVIVAGRVEGTTLLDLPLVGPILLPELSLVALAPATPPLSWPEWTEEPRVRGRTTTYDAQGKLHEAAFFNEDGVLRWRWQYTYTPQGHRQTRTSTDTANVPRWTMRYVYDATGRLQEKVELAADQSLARRWQYTYGQQGRLLEEANYDANGTLLWRWRYAYDARGQRVEESNHTASGDLLWKRRYLYNAHQQVAEEHQYDAAGALMWKRHYTYDAHGNRVDETLYKADGSLESRWRYTYDTYDGYGNWLKRTESKWVQKSAQADFEPVQVTYRTLEYY
jgi:YD repeat-containing protein